MNVDSNSSFSDDMDNVKSDTNTNIDVEGKRKIFWGVYSAKKPYMLNRKDLVTGVARDLFVRHKWNSLIQLAHSEFGDLRIPGFILMRYMLIALYTQNVDTIDINVLKQYFSSMYKIINSKYDFILEMIIYLLHNKSLLPEKSFVTKACRQYLLRARKACNTKHVKIFSQTYKLYEEYLDYIEWNTLNHPSNIHSIVMINTAKVLSNKIKTNLQSIVDELEDPEFHFDIGVLMLLHLFDMDNELPDALQSLEKCVSLQPDNLNFHIYLYEFLSKYPEVPHDPALRIHLLKQIFRLCPDSKYTIRLVNESPDLTQLSLFDRINMVSDFVDYKHNWKSRKAWSLLHKLSTKIDVDSDQFFLLKSFFTFRLRFWSRLHFKLNELKSCIEQLKTFHHSRNESNYTSDSSLSHNETSVHKNPPICSDSRIQNPNYSLFLLKGKFLYQLSQFLVLPGDLEQYCHLLKLD